MDTKKGLNFEPKYVTIFAAFARKLDVLISLAHLQINGSTRVEPFILMPFYPDAIGRGSDCKRRSYLPFLNIPSSVRS